MTKPRLLFQPVVVCLMMACAVHSGKDWPDAVASTLR